MENAYSIILIMQMELLLASIKVIIYYELQKSKWIWLQEIHLSYQSNRVGSAHTSK